MKKILLIFSVCGILLSVIGCGKEVEHSFRINYVYLNQCSSEITVHSFSPNSFGGVIDSLFTIPQGKTHTISFFGRALPGPLQWSGSWVSPMDYTTVSNGEKIVTQTLANNDDLYLLESYIPISEEAYDKTVLYVFTDEFFDNGEPIE